MRRPARECVAVRRAVHGRETLIHSCIFHFLVVVGAGVGKLTKLLAVPRRAAVLFAQGGLCFFCKKPLPASDACVEHLVVSSNGGSNRDENCVACCKSLNALLGSMSLKEKIQVFLNQKGQFECPNGVQRNVTKTGPHSSPKATKLTTESYAQVVANLKQRGSAKPRTVTKLKSTIAALFQNKLRPDEVDALIQQLQSRGVISIAGSKITYA